MEKGNLNVIIFDDQPSEHDHTKSRTINTSKHNPSLTNQHQYDIIEQEMQYLSDKIKKIEQQTDSLALLRNDSSVSKNSSMTNIEPNGTQSKQIFMAIQKKIQIIVRETRKIVDKLGETFQKKLQAKVAKKYDELGVAKIKQNYSVSLKKIEEHYKRQIEKVNRQHRQAETKMVNKVSEMEQRMLSRMNQFDIKQKQYVDWIHHLQIQLKDKQTKSKKMIEVTQDKITSKKEISQSNSTITNNLQNNYSSINPHRQSTNPNDNSKIQRKHRIFDASKGGSSVSPNQKVVSPISTQPYTNGQAPLYATKIINPAAAKSRAIDSQFEVQKPPTVPLATKITQPLKHNQTIQNDSSPWKVIDKSIQKSNLQTKRNQIVKDVDDFYTDIPKANQGWQRFQDFKEQDNSSSDSQQDVLFYREGDRHQQFLQNFRSGKGKEEPKLQNVFGQGKQSPEIGFEQKVFSPFDLN